LQICSLRLPF